MASPITKRSLLIAALLVGQLACLLGGVVLFSQWLETGLNQVVRERILAASRQIASQFARTVKLMDIGGLPLSTEDWERLQELVEQTRLPNEGKLAIISSDTGELLAIRGLRKNPKMHLPIAKALLARPVEKANKWTRLPNGTYVLAARPLPDLGAMMLVLQPAQPMKQVVDDFVSHVRVIGVIVTIGLIALSGLVSLVIVRAYENRMAHINEGLEHIVDRRSRALMRSREAAIFGLAKLAEARDGETGEHLERICAYVEILAEHIARTHPNLTDRWVHTISVAASLHDIGKVGIPDAVLLKPGSLNGDERELVQEHPEIGGRTLSEIQERWGDDPFLKIASQICAGHHEWWDGSGYPVGRSGVHIPLTARIVALADVYDALTSRRAYKEPLSHKQARRMIVEQSGSHFDPSVVDAFLATERQFRAVAQHTPRAAPPPPPPPPSSQRPLRSRTPHATDVGDNGALSGAAPAATST